MPSILETELAASRADLRAERQVAVRYTRKATGLVLEINAVPAHSRRGTVDELGGAVLTSGAAEWLIEAADLVESGALFDPARGDIVERDVTTPAAMTLTYVVTPPDNEAHCWDWHDNAHTSLRVFSKLDRTA